ncbi:MAG: sugar transferase [Holophagales bacterium]|nr:sugar transferase [Holophagales bacterium]
MRHGSDGRRALLATGDALGAVAAFTAVVWLRRLVRLPGTESVLPADRVLLDPWPWLALVALAALLGHALAGTWSEPLATLRERGGLLVAAVLTGLLLVGAFFLLSRALPRTVALLYLPAAWGFHALFRSLVERLLPPALRRVLVLGEGEDARRAAAALEAGEAPGYRLQAWEADAAGAMAEGDGRGPIRGATDVVLASGSSREREAFASLVERSASADFDLWLLPGLADVVASHVATRSLGDLPLTPVEARGASGGAVAFRRLVDLLVGLPLTLLAVFPVALASMLVAAETSGPVWIRQRRVGRGGRELAIWKIRTMREDAERETGPVLATPGDERVTRVGRFLRKTRVDELPQLLHVLSGSMSLVGPRPERPELVEAYVAAEPLYRLRHLLKPGLTGLAQVMGAYATKPDVKLRYDLGYLFHWSPVLDLFVLARTVTTVLRVSGV